MSNRAWMPLHIENYLSDTGHLTATEHGAYMLLIMEYWRKGGLPTDEKLLARLARMSPEQWAESRDVLAAMFVDGWRHKRIEAELAKADEIISKRKAAAVKMHSKRSANAEHVHSKCSDTGGYTDNQEPLTSGSKEPSVRAPAKPTPRNALEKVLDRERSLAVIEHRKRKRAPLTLHAAELLAKRLALFADPNAAADKMIEKGWQSIEPTWDGVPPLATEPGSTRPPDYPLNIPPPDRARDLWQRGLWQNATWGPPPGEPGCVIPEPIQREWLASRGTKIAGHEEAA